MSTFRRCLIAPLGAVVVILSWMACVVCIPFLLWDLCRPEDWEE